MAAIVRDPSDEDTPTFPGLGIVTLFSFQTISVGMVNISYRFHLPPQSS
jgi:hypothetical protein